MMQLAPKSAEIARGGPDAASHFTVFVGGEIFGLPVENTHTIFRIASYTAVPLSHSHIVGLINLRGKIVTAVSLRRRLQMPPDAAIQNALAIGIAFRAENFALIVDQAGDVLTLSNAAQIAVPPHLAPERARLTAGLYQACGLLIPVLNIEALLSF